MTISHRLFAAAVADGAGTPKLKSLPEKPVVIEVARSGVAPAWVNGRPAASHPMISPETWLGERKTTA